MSYLSSSDGQNTAFARKKSSNSPLLLLLSLNNGQTHNDGTNKDEENENENDNDKVTDDSSVQDLSQVFQELLERDQDFSSWMEGLGQWPLPSNNRNTKKKSKEEGRKQPHILSFNGTQKLRRRITPDATDTFTGADTSNNTTTTTASTRLKVSNEMSPGPKHELFLSLPPLPLQQQQQQQQQEEDQKPTFSKESRPAAWSIPGKYRGRINPFSNFIQLEAILDLAAVAGGSNTNDTEPYITSIFAAADQLFKLSKEQPSSVGPPDNQTKMVDVVNNTSPIDTMTILSDIITVEDLIKQKRQFRILPFQLDKLWGFTSPASSSMKDRNLAINKEKKLDSMVLTATANITSSNMDPILYTTTNNATSSSASLAQSAETMLKDTTTRIEDLVAEASNTFLSPSNVQDVLMRASQVFGLRTLSSSSSTNATTLSTTTSTSLNQLEAVSNEIVRAAQRVAQESGVDVQFAADRAREATNFAASMANVANVVFGSGYAYGSRSGVSGMEGYPLYDVWTQWQQQPAATATPPPLFGAYRTAQRIEPFQYENVVIKGAEMGVLAGAIYESLLPRCHKLGHALVANGTTANIAWMVTDSIDYESRYRDDTSTGYNHQYNITPLWAGRGSGPEEEPILVRTITIRGFDASDGTVDREELLNDICTASPVPLSEDTAGMVLFHSGLLSIAKQVYQDIIKYIDWTPPRYKIVLNGHSVGGSLSILILLLLTSERGGECTVPTHRLVRFLLGAF
jgi:hypothetical protein